MNRLTKRDLIRNPAIIGVGNYYLMQELYVDEREKVQVAIEKLAKLEDIEEEIGITLITLFKALKNGIYAKVKNTQEICQISEIISIGEKSLILPSDFRRVVGINVDLDYKDYGKTWALTRQELEVE